MSVSMIPSPSFVGIKNEKIVHTLPLTNLMSFNPESLVFSFDYKINDYSNNLNSLITISISNSRIFKTYELYGTNLQWNHFKSNEKDVCFIKGKNPMDYYLTITIFNKTNNNISFDNIRINWGGSISILV